MSGFRFQVPALEGKGSKTATVVKTTGIDAYLGAFHALTAGLNSVLVNNAKFETAGLDAAIRGTVGKIASLTAAISRDRMGATTIGAILTLPGKPFATIDAFLRGESHGIFGCDAVLFRGGARILGFDAVVVSTPHRTALLDAVVNQHFGGTQENMVSVPEETRIAYVS